MKRALLARESFWEEVTFKQTLTLNLGSKRQENKAHLKGRKQSSLIDGVQDKIGKYSADTGKKNDVVCTKSRE